MTARSTIFEPSAPGARTGHVPGVGDAAGIAQESGDARAGVDISSYRPRFLFPLIRHVSFRVSLWLARTPVTANQLTLSGHVAGFAGVLCFLSGSVEVRALGALAFFVMALCDHCDGEVARLKGIQSRFGDLLSEVGGTAVYAALFLAIGWKAGGEMNDPLWFWFGVSAAAATLCNLIVALAFKVQAGEQARNEGDLALSITPETLADKPGLKDRLLYAFRELLPADAWIMIAVLGVFDLLWLLLPVAAVGAHVFWLAGLTRGARRFHV